MSKRGITRLFVAATLAIVVGSLVALGAGLGAITGGAVALGGPTLVTVDAPALAGAIGWLVIASVIAAFGTLGAFVAWIGALRITFGLEDRSWFLVLLVLGVCSAGWLATAAYVLRGPDGDAGTDGRQRPVTAGRHPAVGGS